MSFVRSVVYVNWFSLCSFLFFFKDTASNEIYTDLHTLSRHDALPVYSALGIALGEYVALLDHDDELHPLALLESVSAFQRNPDWQMLFTDEDKIDEQGE